jgi:hypothetical protein
LGLTIVVIILSIIVLAFISFLIIIKIRSLKNSAGELTKEKLPKSSKTVSVPTPKARKKK